MNASPPPPPPDDSRRPAERLGHLAVVSLKLACAAALLGYLVWRAQQEQAFSDLVEKPKHWGLLAGALALTVVSVMVSFVRWWVVARAAGIICSLHEAIRVSALGFALNFVGPGAVSGDFFKAVIVARGRAGQRAAVFTTILVDRVLGLFSMLLVASVAALALRAEGSPMSPELRLACQTTLFFTVVAVIGVGLLFIPGLVGSWLADLVGRVPLVGGLLAEFVDTWNVYRRHKLLLTAALVMCLIVDFLFVGSFYCVALGLPLDSPSLLHHFFIVPIELTAGAIPITPGGVGTREMVVDLLYEGFGSEPGHGGLIAFAHSLTMLTAGGLAMIYYLSRRASVRASIEEGTDQNPAAEEGAEPLVLATASNSDG